MDKIIKFIKNRIFPIQNTVLHLYLIELFKTLFNPFNFCSLFVIQVNM